MRILGIHTGHNASACFYENGKIMAMASEERFSRKKNQSGFPGLTVDWFVKEYGIADDNLDAVAVASLITPMEEHGWEKGHWYDFASNISNFMPSALLTSSALVKPYLALRSLGQPRLKQAIKLLAPYRISPAKVKLIEHHTCHAHAAYWLDFNRSTQPTLVITLDNTGDGLSGSVRIARNPNDIQLLKVYQSLRSLGMMYTAITRHLGMKKVEDEYKIMGLAPYARSSQVEKVYQILRRHIDLSRDHLDIINRTGLGEDAYVQRFKKDLAGFRFDNIAAGVQLFIETLVTHLLKAWAKKTGIRKLAVGGGVFMNVKLNMLINEMEEFDEVFFLPSCGDENNAAGAALKCAWDLHRAAGKEFEPVPLGPLYLGPASSNAQAETSLRTYNGRLLWKKLDNIERQTAALLAKELVVGRFAGRMEFGARSLGNRSILARADSLNTVRKINSAIKMRDFWMPFAPSVLWERRHDYVVNPKDSPARYMVLGFRSTPKAHHDLIAGLHPFDLSCRPQLVEANWNAKYHKLLMCFEEITGYGGLLNTSFNLHGHPVVCTPADAIDTYLKSDLDVLTIEDYLVWDPARVKLPTLEETRSPSFATSLASAHEEALV